MITKYIIIKPPHFSDLNEAAKALSEGELVAFPTETVYGLGANAYHEKAVRSIFDAKGRPADNPLIVHIAEIAMLNNLVSEIKPHVRKLMDTFWPGPLTLVLKKSSRVPMVTTAGLDTVAVRMPNHPVALELIRRSGVAIAAPSANRSGKPSPTLAQHVLEDLNGRIAWIIDGGPCEIGLESTVLDVTEETPVLLRPGGITLEMLEQVVGKVISDKSMNRMSRPKSPGLKYKHYAPKGEVIVVSGRASKVCQWVNEQLLDNEKKSIKSVILTASEHVQNYGNGAGKSYGSCKKPEEIAANIFRLFRECDEQGIEKIYVEAVPKEGIGYAIMNRIEKAAGGKIVDMEEK